MVVIEELVELESGGAFKWQVSQNNGQLGKFSGFRTILFRRVMNWDPGLTV